MNGSMNDRAKVHDFLQSRLIAKGEAGEFSDTDSLFINGRLDSLDAMEVVVFLEEEFGLDFVSLGFDKTLIDSTDSILALIAEKG